MRTGVVPDRARQLFGAIRRFHDERLDHFRRYLGRHCLDHADDGILDGSECECVTF